MLNYVVGNICKTANRNKQFPASAKIRIEGAIGIQADDGIIIVAYSVAVPRQHQLAISLLDDAISLIQVVTHRDEELAACAKAGVQATIGIQADDRIVCVATVVAVPRQHQLAVSLLDDAVGLVIGAAHRNNGFACTRRAESGCGVDSHQPRPGGQGWAQRGCGVCCAPAVCCGGCGLVLQQPVAAQRCMAGGRGAGLGAGPQVVGQGLHQCRTGVALGGVAAVPQPLGAGGQGLAQGGQGGGVLGQGVRGQHIVPQVQLAGAAVAEHMHSGGVGVVQGPLGHVAQAKAVVGDDLKGHAGHAARQAVGQVGPLGQVGDDEGQSGGVLVHGGCSIK